VIVVDSGSDNDLRALLREFTACGMPLKMLRDEQYRGFVGAANQGLRASSAEYVVLLGSDTRVTSGWLLGLTQTALIDKMIGIVTPRMVDPACEQSILRASPDLPNDPSETPLSPGYRSDDMRRHFPSACEYVDGACMLIKRSVIGALGCLNDRCRTPYYANMDYCLRARRAGFRVVCTLGSDVYQTRAATAQAARGGI